MVLSFTYYICLLRETTKTTYGQIYGIWYVPLSSGALLYSLSKIPPYPLPPSFGQNMSLKNVMFSFICIYTGNVIKMLVKH